MSSHMGWVRRMGLGFRARVIERAISSFWWGRFCVVCWRSFESCIRSCELPYSYIFVVGRVVVFCCLGLYCPFGVMLPMYWVVFCVFLVCLFHLVCIL